MKTIGRRLSKLEHRFGLARNGPRYMMILSERGLENVGDAYVTILDEAGYLPPTGPCIVDLTVIPRGLNAKEEERFVRENGARICSSRAASGTHQPPSGPGPGIELKDIDLAGESIEIKVST